MLLGTQLPDLIDKSLTLLGGPLATGRTVGHSLFGAVILLAAAYVIIPRLTQSTSGFVAFGLAYVTHTFADESLLLLPGTVTGDLVEVSFYFWPLTIPATEMVETLSGLPMLGELIEKSMGRTDSANRADTHPVDQGY